MTILATTQPAFALTPDNHDDHGRRGHHDYNRGWNGKDQDVFSSTNAARDTYKTSHDVFDKVSTTAHASELATHVSGAAGQLATNVAAGALGVAIQATAAATNLAIEKGIASTNLTTEKGIAATNLAIQVSNAQIQLLAVQNASASSLAAATNHAAILLELCKCCGATDALIRAENGATRDLIQSKSETALRDKLHSAEMAIVIANSRLVGAPIVVPG